MFNPNIELPGVQIWDDLLDDRFILDLDEESNLYPWTLNNVANRKSYPYGHKGSHLFWAVTLYNASNPNPPPKLSSNIENLYSYLVNKVIVQRFNLLYISLNGQSLGQMGSCHTDGPANSQNYTLMVFLNYKWKADWGGDFQILKESNNNSEVLHSIKYVPGRVILFDGNLPHRGLAPLEPYVVRKSLVFRLEKI